MIVVKKHGKPRWMDFACKKCGCEYRATMPDFYLSYDNGCEARSNCPECGKACSCELEAVDDE